MRMKATTTEGKAPAQAVVLAQAAAVTVALAQAVAVVAPVVAAVANASQPNR